MKKTHNYPATQTIHTIGILGGGQLGMMLAQSALSLGYQCVFLEDTPNCPAHLYGKVFSTQQFDDFVKSADVFTLEFENTPIRSLQYLQKLADKKQHHGVYPPAFALEVAQDRLKEKTLFNKLGIATVPFMSITSKQEIQQACETLGLPLVLKTSRGGYDGKGQFIIQTLDDIEKAWQELVASATECNHSTPITPLIAEQFIHFHAEASIIAVRSQTGEIKYYNLVKNQHHKGILAKSHAPAVGMSHLSKQAQNMIKTLLQHLDYVGVLTLELFISKNEQDQDILLANEIAPRVHNSGHWSIEGAVTSQFENHIRAVVGLPLGDTSNLMPSIMVNIIGKYPNINDILAIEGTHYHSYYKQEREGRKIAHVTLMPTDATQLEINLEKLIKVLPNPMGLEKSS